jgi:hypothetical protein
MGGAVIALLVLYLLTRSGEPSASVAPDAPASQITAPVVQPATYAAPVPPPVVVAPPAAAVDVSQLRLFGLLSRGAVIGMPDGNQRFVAIGREILPGVTLKSVQVHHAFLSTPSGEVRLGFDGVAQPQAAAALPAAAGESAQRDETLRYRLGLEARTVGRRVSGYTIRSGAELPQLARAGLQPGDLILRVNGSEFGPEQVENLAWQMANSDSMVFDIERSGRPLRLTAPRR